jgi:hypothetical protein
LVDGGSEQWKELITNKSSIQILDSLITEVNGTNKKDFVGLVSVCIDRAAIQAAFYRNKNAIISLSLGHKLGNSRLSSM